MVELLRKEVVELLSESDQMGNTSNLQSSLENWSQHQFLGKDYQLLSEESSCWSPLP